MRFDLRSQQAPLLGNGDRVFAPVDPGRAAISVPVEFRFAELAQLAVKQFDLEHVGLEPLEDQETVAKDNRLRLIVDRLFDQGDERLTGSPRPIPPADIGD